MVPKEKGIIAQSVKDVLQSLVDDRLVCAEKIGISNYYWSFPSAAAHARRQKLGKLEGDLEAGRKREAELRALTAKAGQGREETSHRSQLLERWVVLEAEFKEVTAALDDFKENDPALHEARKAELGKQRTSINRWTDNIMTVQSYCSSNFNIEAGQMREAFAIPSDLDFV